MSDTEEQLPLEGMAADLQALEDRFGPPQPRDPLPGQPSLGLSDPHSLPSRGPNGERITTCRSCGAPIFWSVTTAGKRVPIALATGESHFRDCPDSRQWSKKGKR